MKESVKDKTITILKAFWIGGTMTVPGVSGGSMAMILGLYDKIIGAVAGLLNKKTMVESFLYLCFAGIAGLIGAIAFSPVISYLLESFRMIVLYFFLGTIVGSVPMIVGKSKLDKKSWGHIFFVIPGIILVVLISMLPEGLVDLGSSNALVMIIVGALISIGFVLPGVSFSYLLFVLGIYESLINHLKSLDFLPLIPLCIGLALGIFLLSGFLKKAMEEWPRITFPLILGFMLGSVPQVYPGMPKGSDLVFSILSFVLGAVVIYIIGRGGTKESK